MDNNNNVQRQLHVANKQHSSAISEMMRLTALRALQRGDVHAAEVFSRLASK